MKFKFLVYLVYFVVASSCFAGPEIECAKKIFNFGTMHDGQTVEHTYIITNSGDKVLNIGKIRACCGSVAVISATTIEPGKSADLTAKLRLRNRYGKQDKNIFIASDDPKMPYLQLKFIGEVKRRVVVSPRSVRFKDLKVGQSAEQVVTVTSTLPMNIIKVESSSKAFLTTKNTKSTKESALNTTSSTSTTSTEKTKASFKYTISSVSDKLVKGMNRGTVTLHTDNKDYPRIRIYCRAQVEDSIKVTPSEIVLKKSKKPVTRYIAIRLAAPTNVGRSKTAFNIIDIKVPVKDIKVTYKPRGTNAYLFVVRNIPADEVLDGKSIIIKTDYKNGREIEIPFSVKN
jgi:hypothetical protein